MERSEGEPTRNEADRAAIDRIIERSGKLFFQYGFKRVTMDDIAHSLGMSKKTIYQLLPGKDALVETFITRMMESKLAEASRLFRDEDDIVVSTTRLLRFMQERMAFISPAMVGDMQRHYPHLWDRINERRMRLLRRYLGRIEEAQQQGLIRPDVNPRVMVRMVEVFVSQVATPQTIVELDVPLSEIMRTFLNVTLVGALTDEGRAAFEELKP